MVERARSLLLLAPNWLGDVVMASPLLSRLAAAVDPAGGAVRVHLAVRAAWAPLFAGDPRVSGLVVIERPGRHAGIAGLVRQARDLRGVGAEGIVLGPPSLRAALAAAGAGIGVRVGHRGDGRSALLSVAVARAPRGAVHHADELRDLGDRLLAACGLTAGADAREAAWGLLPVFAGRARPAAPGPLWVLGAGSTYGSAKEWPAAQARAFVAQAVGALGVRVAVLGDGAAAAFAAEVAGGLPVAAGGRAEPWAGVLDLTGRTGIAEAADLLASADGFVGNDSGLMHLAGALGVPTVGIFGSTNPGWTAPLGPRVRTLAAEGFACRPCYRRTCNQPRFCLATIGPDAVLAALADLGATTAKGSA